MGKKNTQYVKYCLPKSRIQKIFTSWSFLWLVFWFKSFDLLLGQWNVQKRWHLKRFFFFRFFWIKSPKPQKHLSNMKKINKSNICFRSMNQQMFGILCSNRDFIDSQSVNQSEDTIWKTIIIWLCGLLILGFLGFHRNNHTTFGPLH